MQLSSQFEEGCIENGGIMRVLEYVCNQASEKGMLLGVFGQLLIRCIEIYIHFWSCVHITTATSLGVIERDGRKLLPETEAVSAEFDIVSKTMPAELEVKKEPLSIKMEGSADNTPLVGLQRPKEGTSTPSAKENAMPYRTPAAKTARKHSSTPGFTPPSTGYGAKLDLPMSFKLISSHLEAPLFKMSSAEKKEILKRFSV